MAHTRDVHSKCLKLIPHKKLSFAKIWLLAAQFEIRQKHLTAARQILGNAIGKAPKDKIFRSYIEIELQLGNIDRCRTLYGKYLAWAPANCYAWSKFAELESSLGETERTRCLFELAIAQPALDMPELLWKAYIEFEISQGENDKARQLYERLLDRTNHWKVWVSYAKFKALQHVLGARGVFERAFESLRTCGPDEKVQRAMLLEEWHAMEKSFEDVGDVSLVQSKMPRPVKRKHEINDGPTRYKYEEEYIDYIFPDDIGTSPNLKILEAAYQWKKKQRVSYLSGGLSCPHVKKTKEH